MKHEQGELFAFKKCENCNKDILADDATTVTKHIGETTHLLHFCGEMCATEYYMERLRSSGM